MYIFLRGTLLRFTAELFSFFTTLLSRLLGFVTFCTERQLILVHNYDIETLNGEHIGLNVVRICLFLASFLNYTKVTCLSNDRYNEYASDKEKKR